jgi:hypothetical protein
VILKKEKKSKEKNIMIGEKGKQIHGKIGEKILVTLSL